VRDTAFTCARPAGLGAGRRDLNRRIDDDFLDPTVFPRRRDARVTASSPAYRAGNVALANSNRHAVAAHDKVILLPYGPRADYYDPRIRIRLWPNVEPSSLRPAST